MMNDAMQFITTSMSVITFFLVLYLVAKNIVKPFEVKTYDDEWLIKQKELAKELSSSSTSRTIQGTSVCNASNTVSTMQSGNMSIHSNNGTVTIKKGKTTVTTHIDGA